MDDLFLMSPSLKQTQVLLDRAAIVLSWARMTVNPCKSRKLLFVRGKILNDNDLSLKINTIMHSIPQITEKPDRFLGRTISDLLSVRKVVDSCSLLVTKGLALINQSKHRPVQKLWIMQHVLLPRLRWPLLIYEIPMITVVILEQKISNTTRQWLCLHNSTTIICLYSTTSPCLLPIKSLTKLLNQQSLEDNYFCQSLKILLYHGNRF